MSPVPSATATAVDAVRDYLVANEIEHDETAREGVGTQRFSLTLPGEKKLQTPVRLDVGAARARRARLRLPQPRREPRAGPPLAARAQPADVRRLVRRRPPRRHLPRGAAAARLVDPDELDRILGSVLANADESFNAILELGFATSIRKEWEWRISRGESTRNLEAFRGWLEAYRRCRGGAWRRHETRALGVRRVSSTPTMASAPPTKVRVGGTSSRVSHATSVAMPGTRNVVSDSAAGVGVGERVGPRREGDRRWGRRPGRRSTTASRHRWRRCPRGRWRRAGR